MATSSFSYYEKRTCIEPVKLLIKLGFYINAKERDGQTALDYGTCESINHQLVKYQLHNGADVNAKTSVNETSLHHVVHDKSNAETATMFGANVEPQGREGLTPL